MGRGGGADVEMLSCSPLGMESYSAFVAGEEQKQGVFVGACTLLCVHALCRCVCMCVHVCLPFKPVFEILVMCIG